MSVRGRARSGVSSECGNMICAALSQFTCCNHVKDSPIELMQATHLVHRYVRLCWNIPEFVFEQQVAWQYSREFFSCPLFVGINLLFVSSCTTRCCSLGTYTLNKCKFEFDKSNCGNISNVQQVYAFFFYIFLVYCTKIPYFSFLEMARTWSLVADSIKNQLNFS